MRWSFSPVLCNSKSKSVSLKFFSIICLAMVLSPFSFINSSIAEEDILNGHGLFWKLEREGREPSYILGTMHVADKRVLKIKDEVEPYLIKASVLYLEIDLTQREMREAYNARLRDDGRTLDEVLPTEIYEKIREISKAHKVEERHLKQLELWAVYPIVKSMPSDPGQEDLDSFEIPLDFQLGQLAKENSVEVKGLETVREQLAVFRERKRKIYYDAIVRALKNPDAVENSLEKMEQYIQWYTERDTNAFYNSLLEDLKDEPPEMYDIWVRRLLNKRNLNMANGMARGLVRGNSFTAVGALHLPGEKGLLKILADRGYTITRLD
ncbi:TraB/GumN family protein [Kiloniella sp.]|uniref:TraB/GumN family protein n=1 Tax=Kiloniella sp. TaxID=1938587 RepID=UPI003B02357D